MTHICVGGLIMIGSDNGLSPGRRQAIIWTNARILLIGTLWTNFSAISIEIYTFPFRKMHLKMSSGKWRPCCLGLNKLRPSRQYLVGISPFAAASDSQSKSNFKHHYILNYSENSILQQVVKFIRNILKIMVKKTQLNQQELKTKLITRNLRAFTLTQACNRTDERPRTAVKLTHTMIKKNISR